MKRLLILLWFISSLAGATEYYVATAGNGGDNGNTGLVGDPWLTLEYACANVAAGNHTINIGAGTFVETGQCVLAVGVSIDGDGATSIIVSNLAGINCLIKLNSVVEGTDGAQTISNIRMDGDALTGYSAIDVNLRSNVIIRNCEFEDFLKHGVTFDGAASGEPTTYATGNEFHDNTVTNCSAWSDGWGGGNLRIGGQEGMLVYDNTIIQSDRGASANGYGIKYAGSGFCKGLKIYDNTITVPAENGTFMFAIELWNSRGGIEIYDNTIIGGVDFGCNGAYINNDAGGYGYAFKVYSNSIGRATLQATNEDGISIERNLTGNAYIYNNIFNNMYVSIGTTMQAGETIEDLYIYYNIIKDCGTSGAGNTGFGILFQGNATGSYDNINIWNNVIDAGATGDPLDGIRFSGVRGGTNFSLRNNIIDGFISNRGVYGLNTTIDIISVENNNLFGNGGSNVVEFDAGTCTITNKTEQNNLTSDPEFATPGSDFTLQVGSPAIDTGKDVGLRLDYLGHVVPFNSIPDIGAYEYGATFPHVPIFFEGKPVFSGGKIVFR